MARDKEFFERMMRGERVDSTPSEKETIAEFQAGVDGMLNATDMFTKFYQDNRGKKLSDAMLVAGMLNALANIAYGRNTPLFVVSLGLEIAYEKAAFGGSLSEKPDAD